MTVTERDGAVAPKPEATRLRNQLHQLLLQVDPEYRAHLPALRTPAGVAALAQYTTPSPRLLDQERAAAVRRVAQRLRLALAQAEDLAAQIRRRAQARFSLLTGLCGVSLLTAGALAGILGPGQRFKTDAQLAAYAGVAPLAPGGLQRRAGAPPAQPRRTSLTRRESEGKTRREAIRALKRFLVRAIWRLWQQCVSDNPAHPLCLSSVAA